MDPVGTARQFDNLKRQINRPGNQGEPLGPGALRPQAVSFRETQAGVRQRANSNEPELGVGYLVGEIQEDLRIVRVWTDVQPFQKVFSNIPDIAMDQP